MPNSRVRKRTVYYFCGFDPRGPAHYLALYRTESAKQFALNGLKSAVGGRKRSGPLASSWEITAETPEGTSIETRYEFFRWDDLIRKLWPRNEAAMIPVALRALWIFLTSGMLRRSYRHCRPPALTMTYPFVFLFTVLAGGVALGVAAAAGLCAILALPWWTGPIPVAATLAGSIALGRRIDRRIHAYWLLRTCVFMADWPRGEVPELDERLKEFARHIAERIRNGDDDEVLIVGHSVGTALAIPLVANILAEDPEIGTRKTAIGLITLGNCIPMASYHAFADVYRNELAAVAEAPGIEWLDFSARRDGASFAGIDLLETSGVPRTAGSPIFPKLAPAAFFRMFSPESFAVIKRDVFRIHFQYLMAGEIQTDYDYFAITAGPVLLRVRFADRPST